MKKQTESVRFTSTTRFKFFDRLKILFGASFLISVETPVEYDMKRGMRALPSIVHDELVMPGCKSKLKPVN